MQTRKRQRSPAATSGLKCSADTCSEVSNQTLTEQNSPSRNKTQLCQELGPSFGLNTGKVLRLFVPCPLPGVTALPSCTHAAEPAKPERASHHHLCRSLQPSHYSAEPPNVPNPLIIPSPWKKVWEALLFLERGDCQLRANTGRLAGLWAVLARDEAGLLRLSTTLFSRAAAPILSDQGIQTGKRDIISLNKPNEDATQQSYPSPLKPRCLEAPAALQQGKASGSEQNPPRSQFTTAKHALSCVPGGPHSARGAAVTHSPAPQSCPHRRSPRLQQYRGTPSNTRGPPAI